MKSKTEEPKEAVYKLNNKDIFFDLEDGRKIKLALEEALKEKKKINIPKDMEQHLGSCGGTVWLNSEGGLQIGRWHLRVLDPQMKFNHPFYLECWFSIADTGCYGFNAELSRNPWSVIKITFKHAWRKR